MHTSNLLQEPSEDYDTATPWKSHLALEEKKKKKPGGGGSLAHLELAVLSLAVVPVPCVCGHAS